LTTADYESVLSTLSSRGPGVIPGSIPGGLAWDPSTSTLVERESDDASDSESIWEGSSDLDEDDWLDEIDESGWDEYNRCCSPWGPEGTPESYIRETEQCMQLLDNLFGLSRYSPQWNPTNGRNYYIIPGVFLGRCCERVVLPQEDILIIGSILFTLQTMSVESRVQVTRALHLDGDEGRCDTIPPWMTLSHLGSRLRAEPPTLLGVFLSRGQTPSSF